MPLRQTRLERIVDDSRNHVGSGRRLAIALHDFVRDHIAFGFTPYFDAAAPEVTLRLGTGHCNPQAWLMVELFRLAGFEARYRPSTITNGILRGVARVPPRLSHIFTEVRVDCDWARLDSYIVDPKLRHGVVEKLNTRGEAHGYGCHQTATGEWDGVSDSFSQIEDPSMIVELHDPVRDIESFYRTKAYEHQIGPVSYNMLFAPGRLFVPLAMAHLNRRITAIRRGGAGA